MYRDMGKGRIYGREEEEEERRQIGAGDEENERTWGKKRGKRRELPIGMKRGAVPRNRAIKALLLASDRAAREAHCFEFETSVRSERSPDQIPPINWGDTRECSDGCTQNTLPRIHKRALNGETWENFVGYLKRNFYLYYEIICEQDTLLLN